MATAYQIRTKRVYEAPTPDDGCRILIDRLWPRGLSKERAHLDAWRRDLAPSTELRHWSGHDPGHWNEFVVRYQEELATPERQAALDSLIHLAAESPLTLLYAARDTAHNEALVIAQVLERALAAEPAHGHEAPASKRLVEGPAMHSDEGRNHA